VNKLIWLAIYLPFEDSFVCLYKLSSSFILNNSFIEKQLTQFKTHPLKCTVWRFLDYSQVCTTNFMT
jgi:hypothetical protein